MRECPQESWYFWYYVCCTIQDMVRSAKSHSFTLCFRAGDLSEKVCSKAINLRRVCHFFFQPFVRARYSLIHPSIIIFTAAKINPCSGNIITPGQVVFDNTRTPQVWEKLSDMTIE